MNDLADRRGKTPTSLYMGIRVVLSYIYMYMVHIIQAAGTSYLSSGRSYTILCCVATFSRRARLLIAHVVMMP
jgi:hypothetical protein